jgi:RecA/RadA recombinase
MQNPISKTTEMKRARDMAQAVEHLTTHGSEFKTTVLTAPPAKKLQICFI